MLTSDQVNQAIDGMIMAGEAVTGREAELRYLTDHLDDLLGLIEGLDDAAFQQHELIRLLMFYGSRTWEDDLS